MAVPANSGTILAIQIGMSSVIPHGETVSGDASLVECKSSHALIAAVDGGGHGAQAAVASRLVLEVLTRDPNESMISLVRRCHRRLRGSRGAVMSMASFDANARTMTWLGVGNVEGVLVRAHTQPVLERESLLLTPGTLGYQLPSPRIAVLPVREGDTLIFATDGIHTSFLEDVSPDEDPQAQAERICRKFNSGADDSLVLVVRYMTR
jgi:negative regulator of sigma-B (phosphoserine phosphatase)